MQFTVGIVSLGCDKNRVDSENAATSLKANGYTITDDLTQADVIIINTCAFLNTARQEASDNISKYAQYKNYKLKKLVVMGCLTSYKPLKLKERYPDVDLFLPIEENVNIASHINKLLESGDEKLKEFNKRLISTPSHYAYLKIADGCNNFCTYCLIPYLRGRYKSEPMEKLVDEAKYLASIGVKELIVIAQDVTNYGIDLYGSRKLVDLIRKLSKIKGIDYIRLHYCYPDGIDEALIDEIKNNHKVVKYLDVPIQHISDNVLKSMGRHINKADTIAMLRRLKDKIPGLTLRTTLMVGFPGETRHDYKELCDFLKLGLIENVGFFAYSREEGTRSYKLPHQVPEYIKRIRLRNIEKLQTKLMREAHIRLLYNDLDVIIDDVVDDYYIGRPLGSSPDIDPVVYVFKDKELNIGQTVIVKLVDLYKYDFIGELL